jgi:hypothetical protein
MRISDIRYFESAGLVDQGAYHYYTGTLYHVPPELPPWASRVAYLCRQRGVTIGHPHALYLCFTPVLADGYIRPIDYRPEIWQRYVLYGMPLTFNKLDAPSRAKRVRMATAETLKAIAPNFAGAVDEAVRLADAGGEDLVITLKVKKTKKYHVEIGRTIPDHPKPSEVWLTIEELATGRRGRCKLIETAAEWEGAFLVGRITFAASELIVRPFASHRAKWYAKKNNVSAFVMPIEPLLAGRVPRRVRRAYRTRSK